MIKRFIAIFAMVLFLAACADQLPPSPPPPGQAVGVGGAIAGLAAQYPNWAAEPRNAAVTPTDANLGSSVMISVSEYEYIYSKGYYFDSQRKNWIPFTLSGEQVEDWIKSQAIASITVHEQRFAPGENYILVYACNKISGAWDCNGNRWMLLRFNAIAPEKPKTVVTGIETRIIPQNIQSFDFQSMDGEPDNFESTIVTRYDARYRSNVDYTFVLAHVFEFNNKQELDNTMNTLFKDIVQMGGQMYNSQKIALFLDEYDHRVAVWTSGNKLIYIETHKPEYAAKEILEAYLQKYPSELR